MAKDRQVTAEGQDLPCIRSDAAAEDGSTDVPRDVSRQTSTVVSRDAPQCASHPAKPDKAEDKERPSGVMVEDRGCPISREGPQ